MKNVIKIDLAEENRCCGCGSCALVCPVQAIQMVPKELGCSYPEIDYLKCIGCLACESACVSITRLNRICTEQKVFAVATRKNAILEKSASGGVFATVAHRIIEAGGIVYGCSLELQEGKLFPMHIGIEKTEDVKKLQGSKYVQSALGSTFFEIRNHLKNGRMVLFSGTPCQVDALKHFLRNMDASNLFTMDLVCHGVPSEKLFQEYLEMLGKNKGAIIGFSFRDKADGWGLNASYEIVPPDKKNGIRKKLPPELSSYYTYFLKSEIYRESCYSCLYAGLNRVGDITIGDFWGIEQEHPEMLEENGGPFCSRQGISTVLVNTEQGCRLLEQYGEDLEMRLSEQEKVSKWNRQLKGPSVHSQVREKLIKTYQNNGYYGIEHIFRDELGIRYFSRIIRHSIRAAWKKL